MTCGETPLSFQRICKDKQVDVKSRKMTDEHRDCHGRYSREEATANEERASDGIHK